MTPEATRSRVASQLRAGPDCVTLQPSPAQRGKDQRGLAGSLWGTRALLLAGLCSAMACSAAQLQPAGPPIQPAELTQTHARATDGYRLPLHQWSPDGEPHSIVLGLHGFNDYGGGLDALATTLASRGIKVYAYDQRGFGATEDAGIWHTHEALARDASAVSRLLRARYPETPLYLLGKSMGGAVALVALGSGEPPPVDGIVLIAPALAGTEIMPWYQRFGLWLGEQLAPGIELSVELAERVGVTPTDEASVIEALRADPLVQRTARVDTLDGLAELMDAALDASSELRGPGLILYGERDELIPAEALCLMLDRLPKATASCDSWTVRIYPEGYHMLTRYSGREQTHSDIAEWLHGVPGHAPGSGHGMDPQQAKRHLCE